MHRGETVTDLWPSKIISSPYYSYKVLHVEIVLKTKQPEAETSLVYDVFIRVIKKESASWTSDESKKKRNKHVKHVKCKEVLRFICGLMKQG